MNDIIKEMHEPCLFNIGFYVDEKRNKKDDIRQYYKFNTEKAKGSYWVYAYKNLFSISCLEFTSLDDFYVEFLQPDYISISYYDSISGEELSPYKRIQSNCIRGHIGNNNLYRAVYHKNIPIKSISIEIMPEYYNDYLNKKYPGVFKHPKSAFKSIDGATDFPQLVLILRQLASFSGSGISAQMYYESKVIEIVSLIIEKTKNTTSFPSHKNICNIDMNNIKSVASYIDDHFSQNISMDLLSKIACMGTTKLKYTFKNIFNCTITEYTQNRRLSQAENLLSTTDLSIKQIANAVGYSHCGYFSNIFHKSTGLLPTEYRKVSYLNK